MVKEKSGGGEQEIEQTVEKQNGARGEQDKEEETRRQRNID